MQYQETEASRNARQYLRTHRIIPLAAEMVFNPNASFDERMRGYVVRKDGSLDTTLALEMLGDVDVQNALVMACIRCNYSKDEVHAIIKARYRREFGPQSYGNQDGYCGGLHLTMTGYPEWCRIFGIEPDPNFPDWGDRNKARLQIAHEIEFIEAGVEERLAWIRSGRLN